jgi:hypothetical protein
MVDNDSIVLQRGKNMQDLDSVRSSLTDTEQKTLHILLLSEKPLSMRAIRNQLILHLANNLDFSFSVITRLWVSSDPEEKKIGEEILESIKFFKDYFTKLLLKQGLTETKKCRLVEKELKKNSWIKIPSYETMVNAAYTLKAYGLISERENPNKNEESGKTLWFVVPDYRSQYVEKRKEIEKQLLELKNKYPLDFGELLLNRITELEFYNLLVFFKELQKKTKTVS